LDQEIAASKQAAQWNDFSTQYAGIVSGIQAVGTAVASAVEGTVVGDVINVAGAAISALTGSTPEAAPETAPVDTIAATRNDTPVQSAASLYDPDGNTGASVSGLAATAFNDVAN